MNLAKSYEFFNPDNVKEPMVIIGCGSVGSTVAELLARFGLERFILFDSDVVQSHNLVNQMFVKAHINQPKTKCVKEIIQAINPDAQVRTFENWNGEQVSGYVFLCADNIDVCRQVCLDNQYNPSVKAMFNFRTGLTDAQHYAADWSDLQSKKEFIKSMNFTHEQAQVNQVMSACHVSMCVAPTVRMIANVGVANFVNFVKGEHLYRVIPIDAFRFEVDALG